MMPAFRNAFIRARTRLSTIRVRTRSEIAEWSSSSKELAASTARLDELFARITGRFCGVCRQASPRQLPRPPSNCPSLPRTPRCRVGCLRGQILQQWRQIGWGATAILRTDRRLENGSSACPRLHEPSGPHADRPGTACAHVVDHRYRFHGAGRGRARHATGSGTEDAGRCSGLRRAGRWVPPTKSMGVDSKFRLWLKQRQIGHVVVVPSSEPIMSLGGNSRADRLVADAPSEA